MDTAAQDLRAGILTGKFFMTAGPEKKLSDPYSEGLILDQSFIKFLEAKKLLERFNGLAPIAREALAASYYKQMLSGDLAGAELLVLESFGESPHTLKSSISE